MTDPSLEDEAERQRRCTFVNARWQQMGSFGPYRLLVGQRVRSFEFNGVCGPVPLDLKGEPYKRLPGPASLFWSAFEAWREAGCHVDRYGRAFVPSPASGEVRELHGD